MKKRSRSQAVAEDFPNLKLEELRALDPSNNDKYIYWIAKQIARNHDKNDIRPTLEGFINNFPRLPEEKREINAFDDLKDLENLLKDIGDSNRKLRKLSGGNATFLGEIDIGTEKPEKYKVIAIGDRFAAAKYGKGTRWCISMISGSYYTNYSMDNNIFYFFLKSEQSDEFCEENKLTKVELESLNSEKIAMKYHFSSKRVELWGANDALLNKDKCKKYQKLVELALEHAKDIPYTIEYGCHKGTATPELFLEKYWAINKQQYFKSEFRDKDQ